MRIEEYSGSHVNHPPLDSGGGMAGACFTVQGGGWDFGHGLITWAGGMETLSNLKCDRFRELFTLLELKNSKSRNRYIYIFHVSKSTRGDEKLKAIVLSRGGMPGTYFTLNHPRGD